MRTLYGRLLPKYRGKIAIGRMVETSATSPVVLGVSNFMQNDEVLLDVIRAGQFVHPCHPGGLNRVDLRDLGDIAANVLLDPDVPAGAYPVVGPRSLTGPECAQVWSEALGVPVSYAGDDDAALEAALTVSPVRAASRRLAVVLPRPARVQRQDQEVRGRRDGAAARSDADGLHGLRAPHRRTSTGWRAPRTWRRTAYRRLSAGHEP